MTSAAKGVKVYIRCATYNQEKYIRKCLDGFVMQKTNFCFKAVVHDDASTDGTCNIIREYAEKYPNIIVPIFEKENQYSKGLDAIFKILTEATKDGEYIAICEGDDYWTDPLKLQKQVDFLDSHPEYSLCSHWSKEVVGLDYDNIKECNYKYVPEDLDILGVAESNYIYTATAMYRNDPRIIEKRLQMSGLGAGDYPLWMSCASIGKVKILPEYMSVYRVGVGIWGSHSRIAQLKRTFKLIEGMESFFSPDVVSVLRGQRIKVQENLITLIEDELKDERFRLETTLNSTSYKLGQLLLKPLKLFK